MAARGDGTAAVIEGADPRSASGVAAALDLLHDDPRIQRTPGTDAATIAVACHRAANPKRMDRTERGRWSTD